MKTKLIIISLLLSLCSCVYNKSPEGLITAKVDTTMYYISSYKNSNIYLSENQYDSLIKYNDSSRIRKENKKYFIINGKASDKIFVDKYIFEKYNEGDNYKEY